MSKQQTIDFWLAGCTDQVVVDVVTTLISDEFDVQNASSILDFNMPLEFIATLQENFSSYAPPTDQDLVDERAKIQRTNRNKLLAETDYFALTDVTLTAEMTTYRQALRGLPSQAGFPHNITWPTKPAE